MGQGGEVRKHQAGVIAPKSLGKPASRSIEIFRQSHPSPGSVPDTSVRHAGRAATTVRNCPAFEHTSLPCRPLARGPCSTGASSIGACPCGAWPPCHTPPHAPFVPRHRSLRAGFAPRHSPPRAISASSMTSFCATAASPLAPLRAIAGPVLTLVRARRWSCRCLSSRRLSCRRLSGSVRCG